MHLSIICSELWRCRQVTFLFQKPGNVPSCIHHCATCWVYLLLSDYIWLHLILFFLFGFASFNCCTVCQNVQQLLVTSLQEQVLPVYSNDFKLHLRQKHLEDSGYFKMSQGWHHRHFVNVFFTSDAQLTQYLRVTHEIDLESNQIWLNNCFRNQHPKCDYVWKNNMFWVRKLIQKSNIPNAKMFEKINIFWIRKLIQKSNQICSELNIPNAKMFETKNMFWIRKLIQTSNQIWLTNGFTNQHPKWFCIRKLIQKSITPNAKMFEKSTCFETKNELSFWIWYSFYVFHFLEEAKIVCVKLLEYIFGSDLSIFVWRMKLI